MLHDLGVGIVGKNILFHVLVRADDAHDLIPRAGIGDGEVFDFFEMHLIVLMHFKPAVTGGAIDILLAGLAFAVWFPRVGAFEAIKFSP